MAQNGYVFRQGRSWFLRYRDNFTIDGMIVRKQKCVKLADFCDRYRCERDLEELVAEKIGQVRESAKCPSASVMFVDYVEKIYLPFARRTTKPSTYAGRKTYFLRYIKPRVANLALRDFTTATVYGLLEEITQEYSLNVGTVSKVRSILHHIFTYAKNKGDVTGANPAADVLIPETATKREATEATTLEEVQAILGALKAEPLARAAVAIIAFTGVRPGEARGLRWEEWDRAKQHIAVNRSVWHREVGTPKTDNSTRLVTVSDGLRMILLDLWNAKGCPISGYILAGTKKHQPVILDNLAKRVIRPLLEKAKQQMDAKEAGLLTWKGWYSLRRFHGTQVRNYASSETSAKALGNTRAVFDKHYLKPTEVLPDVRQAVTQAVSGLVQ
jgi:integrase